MLGGQLWLAHPQETSAGRRQGSRPPGLPPPVGPGELPVVHLGPCVRQRGPCQLWAPGFKPCTPWVCTDTPTPSSSPALVGWGLGRPSALMPEGVAVGRGQGQGLWLPAAASSGGPQPPQACPPLLLLLRPPYPSSGRAARGPSRVFHSFPLSSLAPAPPCPDPPGPLSTPWAPRRLSQLLAYPLPVLAPSSSSCSHFLMKEAVKSLWLGHGVSAIPPPRPLLLGPTTPPPDPLLFSAQGVC